MIRTSLLLPSATFILILVLITSYHTAYASSKLQIWRDWPSYHIGNASFNGTVRYGARMTTIKSGSSTYLYLFGGINEAKQDTGPSTESDLVKNQPTRFVIRKNVAGTWKAGTGEWENVIPLSETDATPPNGLIDFTIVPYPDSGGKSCALLFGGKHTYVTETDPGMGQAVVKSHNRTWLFCHDPSQAVGQQDKWYSDPAAASTSKPQSRYGHAAVVVQHEMWITCGASRHEMFELSVNAVLPTDLWKLSFDTLQWTQYAINGTFFTPRFSPAYAVNETRRTMFVFGGAPDPTFDAAKMLPFRGDLWAINLPTSNAEMVIPVALSTEQDSDFESVTRRMRGGMILQAEQLVIFGGQPKPFKDIDDGIDASFVTRDLSTTISYIKIFDINAKGRTGWGALNPVANGEPRPSFFASNVAFTLWRDTLYMVSGWYTNDDPNAMPSMDGSTPTDPVKDNAKKLWQLYLCPRGSMLAAGGDLCSACSAGHYQPPADLWGDCTQCGYSMYAARPSGSQSCLACPTDSVTLSVATADIKGCKCRVGYYGSGTCTPCPLGGDCPNYGMRYPNALPGYWLDSTNPTSPLPCPTAAACKGGAPGSIVCGTGYDGFFCSKCLPNFYKLGNECIGCPDPTLQILGKIFALVLIIALAAVLFVVAHRAGGAGNLRPATQMDWSSLSIVLGFVQVTALFSTFDITWPQPLRGFIDFLTAFNLNVDLVSPECTFDFTYFHKFMLAMAIPLIFGGTFLLIAGCEAAFLAIKRSVKKGRNTSTVEVQMDEVVESSGDATAMVPAATKRSFARKIAIGFLLFIHLAYVAVVAKTFEFFNCQAISGKRYLAAELAIPCDIGAWNDTLPLAISALIVYVFGIPIGFLFLALRVRRFNSQNGVKHVLSVLFSRYRPGFEHYEFFVMIRKMLIAGAVVVFTESSIWQILTGAIALLAALLLQTFARPYNAQANNWLEFLGIGTNYLTLFSGLLFTAPKFPTDLARDAVALAVVIIVAGAVVCGTAAVVYRMMHRVKSAFNKKNDEAEEPAGDDEEPASDEAVGEGN